MAVARDLDGSDRTTSWRSSATARMSAGMAYEAMNNAGALNSRLIVILNDNDMSIAPPVGAMSAYLVAPVLGARLPDAARHRQAGRRASCPRRIDRTITPRRGARPRLPDRAARCSSELGFYYVGPIDGHNLDHLLPVLRNVRDAATGPILVHVRTQKGKGYAPAEASADKYHGVSTFDVVTGAQAKAKPNAPAYTARFRREPGGGGARTTRWWRSRPPCRPARGSTSSPRQFPSGPSMSASPSSTPSPSRRGSRREGYQALLRHLLHLPAARASTRWCTTWRIQNLPVRFALDRAGLVGADGPTHAGSFDVAYLGCLPNMVADGGGRRGRTRPHGGDRRGPRPRADRAALSARRRRRRRLARLGRGSRIGKGRVLRQGDRAASPCCPSAPGWPIAWRAADELAARGVSTTVADARFAKPLDTATRGKLARDHDVLVTVEEGSVGGFGSFVLHHLAGAGLLDHGLKIRLT